MNAIVTTPRYDGNISFMEWSSDHSGVGVDVTKGYRYEYDGVKQLQEAKYLLNTPSGWTLERGYDERDITYDLNGNITKLNRSDKWGNRLHRISNEYNGNQLSFATINADGWDYNYDANGNMTYDGHKKVTMSYNFLDLPEKIFAGTEEVSYVYSATGQKLATKAGSSTTYYRGSFIYNDDELDHLLQPEGIIRKTTGAYVYYYAKKDHLGSTRVLCHEANGKMLADQTTDYYPFGLSHHSNATNVNRYLFSGKEFQDQTVNGKSLMLYDFGARNYDPVLGRWFNIDPALQFTNPYIYCANNPVNMIDPDGKDAIYITYPNYRANGIPFTGHAGVLLINPRTGLTKYYEYGRYGSKVGMVRSYEIPNVVIGEDGMPTNASLNKVMMKLSAVSGHYGEIEGAYIKSDKFNEMNNYAKKKEAEWDDPNREPYSILGNNCATFAEDVILQDGSIDAPFYVVPSPVNIVHKYQDQGSAVEYDPKTGKTKVKEERGVTGTKDKEEEDAKKNK